MKAAYVDHPGSPQQIRYGDVPTPIIGKRDILVKTIAVTINGVDTYIRSGRFQTDMPLPFIIGRDMTGEVIEVGNEVNIYWDITSHFDAEKAMEVIAQRGRLIVIAGISQKTTFPVGPFYLRNCSLYGFTLTDSTVEELHYSSEQINQWLTKGALKGKFAQKLPLSQSAQAHQIYESKNLFGKLVLSPAWET